MTFYFIKINNMTRHLPHVIAVCGFKRCGKDSIANYVVQKYGYVNYKFADPLKKCMKELFLLTDDQLETSLKDAVDPVWNTSPRALMQFLGTDVMQFQLQQVIPHIGRRFWSDRLVKDLQNKNSQQRVVISDLRFPHEIESLKKYTDSILVIKVSRTIHAANVDEHCSEKEFHSINYDICIENNGTLADLYDQIDKVFNQN